jgi:hypothetical protein
VKVVVIHATHDLFDQSVGGRLLRSGVDDQKRGKTGGAQIGVGGRVSLLDQSAGNIGKGWCVWGE